MDTTANLAILIDAENVLPGHADLIFSHAATLGSIIHKEIYGAASALSAWVAPVLKYAIHPNLTIKAAKGKNSSDIALVIGAMDLLLLNDVNAVVIASSDSDFSALSVRLRNAGIEVIGMGTEKANDLWRTACSTFVVLQNPKPNNAPKQSSQAPKPAQPQKPAASAQAQQQEAPAPKSGRRARTAASTHEERTAVIRAMIEKRLAEHGGRLQVSTLFPTLNRMAEYRVDKQGSGKKPLNYLTSTFGAVFRFEEMADGQSWVSLNGVAPEAVGPAGEGDQVAPEPVEAGLDDVAEAAAVVRVEDRAPVEPGIPAKVEVSDVPASDGEPDPLALLMDAGLTEEVARQIVVIFTESRSLRAAYNRLRSTFGSTTGREYYQLVKEIAGRQQSE